MKNDRIYSEEELLSLSGIQHYAFCDRQWALIHLEKQWQENLRTVEGSILHERVHNSDYHESRGGIIYARSLPLLSYRLGLFGVADLVEFHPVEAETKGVNLPGRSGFYMPYPVEYKRGKQKKDDRDVVQLCAQALCLEEMLDVSIERGSLYYGQTQRRRVIKFDQELRNRVLTLARNMHKDFSKGITPPARKGQRCSLCSLEDVCLPKLTQKRRSISDYLDKQLQIDKTIKLIDED